MPKFSQRPIAVKSARNKAIPQEIIDQYAQYVEQLKRGNEGILEFGKNENMALGRRALIEAGIQAKKYLKVSKVRGMDNTLKFIQISKREWEEWQRRSRARSEKIRKARQQG